MEHDIVNPKDIFMALIPNANKLMLGFHKQGIVPAEATMTMLILIAVQLANAEPPNGRTHRECVDQTCVFLNAFFDIAMSNSKGYMS